MSFIEKYREKKQDFIGIPGIDMNRPLGGTNTLSDIGLELEIEGRGLPTEGNLAKIIAPTSKAMWTCHQDGSLRGENQEYVLGRPCAPEEVSDMVKALYDVFKTRKSVLNLSNRCSTHVHVNIGGYRVNELTSVIVLWTAFEELLVNFCGEQRTSNHFCLGAKDTNHSLLAWNRLLKTGNLRFEDGLKYSALNIRPIFDRGSVEFRCMRADTETQPIIDWALFCLALVRYAKERYENPSIIANEISERTGSEIFLDICKKAGVSKDFISAVIEHPENKAFDDKVIQGFRRAQNLSLGFPWYDWLPLIQTKSVTNPFGKAQPKKARVEPDWADVVFEEAPRPWEIPPPPAEEGGQNPNPAAENQIPNRIIRWGDLAAAIRFNISNQNAGARQVWHFNPETGGVNSQMGGDFVDAIRQIVDVYLRHNKQPPVEATPYLSRAQTVLLEQQNRERANVAIEAVRNLNERHLRVRLEEDRRRGEAILGGNRRGAQVAVEPAEARPDRDFF